MDKALLGKRIREERLLNHLTQEQLAEYINVSTTYIGFIERGERSVTLDKVIKIANCLHVSIDYLLSDSINTNASSDTAALLSLWNSASSSEKALILDLIKSVLRHDMP